MCNTGTGTLLAAGSAVIEPAVKQRLLRHLDTCSSEIDLDFSNSTVVIPDVSMAYLLFAAYRGLDRSDTRNRSDFRNSENFIILPVGRDNFMY